MNFSVEVHKCKEDLPVTLTVFAQRRDPRVAAWLPAPNRTGKLLCGMQARALTTLLRHTPSISSFAFSSLQGQKKHFLKGFRESRSPKGYMKTGGAGTVSKSYKGSILTFLRSKIFLTRLRKTPHSFSLKKKIY